MTEASGHLLVVDDDQTNRDLLSRRLKRSGFAVESVGGGAEALAYLDTRPTDLVLLDVQMPDMSGLEVLQEIRRTRSSSVLPVLMVTAKNQTEDVVTALELGADDYITKPIDFPVALARIRTQLSRKRAEDGLRESEQRYALAAEGANDGLWDWDLVTGEVYFSPRWKAIVGCDEPSIGEQPEEWFDRVHHDDLPLVRQNLEDHLAGRTAHFESEHRIRHTSGVFRWVLARGLVVRDADGTGIRIAGSLSDFTEGKVLDALTGLPNLLLLTDRLEQALRHQRSHDARPCAVLLLDLDEFKRVNDGLGQEVGDALIRAVAGRLESTLRRSDTIGRPLGSSTDLQTPSDDTVARIGGDEFVVMLQDVRNIIDASRVADRIQQSLAGPIDVSGHQVFTTASIGIVMSSPSYSSAEEVLRDADTAMHRAKAAGQGRSEIFDATMREEAVRRLHLDTDLRLALARDEFVPYFQPIIDLGTGELVGFEALIRWRHPTRGLVSPMEFVPATEENGLVVPIGHRLLEQVCHQLREWQDTYPSAERLWVNVNFASQQFLEDGLISRLLGTLEHARVSPSQIIIEITERTAIQDAQATSRVMEQLQEAGVRVVMDDFGTGYSSLMCLHQLPITGLKLDLTLLEPGERNTALVRAVVALSESLGLSVTAEGIETEAQCEQLTTMGCDLGQGYLFERPVPGEQAAQIIARGPGWLSELMAATPRVRRQAG